MVNKWTVIKLCAGHVFGDYGLQTGHMAQHKRTDTSARLQHCAGVAVAMSAALATDNAMSNGNKAAVVALNTVAHYGIDSLKIPKVIDQALHLAIAVASVFCVVWSGNAAQRRGGR